LLQISTAPCPTVGHIDPPLLDEPEELELPQPELDELDAELAELALDELEPDELDAELAELALVELELVELELDATPNSVP
jgi:hypothetical protein